MFVELFPEGTPLDQAPLDIQKKILRDMYIFSLIALAVYKTPLCNIKPEYLKNLEKASNNLDASLNKASNWLKTFIVDHQE